MVQPYFMINPFAFISQDGQLSDVSKHVELFPCVVQSSDVSSSWSETSLRWPSLIGLRHLFKTCSWSLWYLIPLPHLHQMFTWSWYPLSFTSFPCATDTLSSLRRTRQVGHSCTAVLFNYFIALQGLGQACLTLPFNTV